METKIFLAISPRVLPAWGMVTVVVVVVVIVVAMVVVVEVVVAMVGDERMGQHQEVEIQQFLSLDVLDELVVVMIAV